MERKFDFIESDLGRDCLKELAVGKNELVSELVGLGFPVTENFYINNRWNIIQKEKPDEWAYHASHHKDNNENYSIECLVGFSGTEFPHSISIAIQPIEIDKK